MTQRSYALALTLLALVLVERVNEDGDFYPALEKRVFYPRVPLLAAIPKDARFTGAGSALIPNNAALYGLEDARGYQAMTFRRLYETYPLGDVTVAHEYVVEIDASGTQYDREFSGDSVPCKRAAAPDASAVRGSPSWNAKCAPHASSATRIAPTSSAILRKRAKSMVRG